MSVDRRFLEDLITAVHSEGADLNQTACLLRCLQLASGEITPQWLTARGFDIARDGRFQRCLGALIRVGILQQAGKDRWHNPHTGHLSDMAIAISGAAAAWSVSRAALAPDVAITLPQKPSALGRALEGVLLDYSHLVATEDGLHEIARRAVDELVILTPFLNEAAAPSLASVFAATKARNRILVVRRFERVRRALACIRDELIYSGVQIFDYYRMTDGEAYETFHAKVVLADSHHAYVGSANFLRYSRASVEIGVIFHGNTVRVISKLVRAIRAISTRCEIPLGT